MKLKWLALFILLGTQDVLAQINSRYLLLFKDKADNVFSLEKAEEFLSPKALARRYRQNIPISESDLPVSPSYLARVAATGAKVISTTRWFNGALVEANESQLKAIKMLPFFSSIEGNHPVLFGTEPGEVRMAVKAQATESPVTLDYGLARTQTTLLGADYFHQKGILGQEIVIAAFDEGFSRADQLEYFKLLFDEKRVLETYDFIAGEVNVYDKQSHGTNVLSTIAAYQPGMIVGIAPKAKFVLYRTESNMMESPYEEVAWLLAAERADSIGVDIITSSLGYSTFIGPFNNADYNYTYEDMDGHTTIVSRAARWASRKGIVVVNSAGNEASSPWKYIIAPADVDSVLSVGATNRNLEYASFSSIGPNALGQQKPDVSAVGLGVYIGTNVGTGTVVSSQGTSFSCPQVAGLVALAWQAYPFLTAQQVISVLKKSGNQADRPDNYLGYGVPNLRKLEQIVATEYGPLAVEPQPPMAIRVAPNPVMDPLTLLVPTVLKNQPAQISIIKGNGQEIYRTSGLLEPTVYLAIPDLSPGIYILKVQTKSQQQVIRIVKP
ncbi:S8 family peptidase [Dyadobacter tibetensis]|uniref:S8 family peptidase n=1 Tax=Dyadobacter tibetensis TaxID=1211851 RepID=UPI00047103F6|nr:S8 family peptidase [Dyadobacter tibetensis]